MGITITGITTGTITGIIITSSIADTDGPE